MSMDAKKIVGAFLARDMSHWNPSVGKSGQGLTRAFTGTNVIYWCLDVVRGREG